MENVFPCLKLPKHCPFCLDLTYFAALRRLTPQTPASSYKTTYREIFILPRWEWCDTWWRVSMSYYSYNIHKKCWRYVGYCCILCHFQFPPFSDCYLLCDFGWSSINSFWVQFTILTFNRDARSENQAHFDKAGICLTWIYVKLGRSFTAICLLTIQKHIDFLVF